MGDMIRLLSFCFSPVVTGADPWFLLGGGAPLRNNVTDRWGKQILKANTKKKASFQRGGGVRTPCTLPRDPPCVKKTFFSFEDWENVKFGLFQIFVHFWLAGGVLLIFHEYLIGAKHSIAHRDQFLIVFIVRSSVAYDRWGIQKVGNKKRENFFEYIENDCVLKMTALLCL